MIFGAVQFGQVIDQHEVEHGGDEHAEQVLEPVQHDVAEFPVAAFVGRHQHQDENGQAE